MSRRPNADWIANPGPRGRVWTSPLYPGVEIRQSRPASYLRPWTINTIPGAFRYLRDAQDAVALASIELRSYSLQELLALKAAEDARAQAEAENARRDELRQLADAERSRFKLTGSDRPADDPDQDHLF